MTYKETTEWMFGRLPMYQMQGAVAYKADLANTLLLAAHLGNPENKLKTIHVAGTNGKGSVSSMLASILQEAGYKVGLYTSPHLKDFRERIKINGEDISEAFIVDFVAKNKAFFEANDLSFFEMTVGLAFDYFVQENIDIAVVETGMGGRLDSTNIITPLVSVITNIGMDHTQFLGNTLQAIAGEKAGIIKPGTPVVVGEYTPETKPVFESKASEKRSAIYFAQDEVLPDYPSALLGDYQRQNKKTVLKTVEVLQSALSINGDAVKTGLLNVIKNTGLRGRWEQIHTNPAAIADTAHNSHGLKPVMAQLLNQKYTSLHIVFGVVNDKNLDEVLPLLPKKATYYFAKPGVPRGLDAQILANAAKKYNLNGKIFESVKQAYDAALQQAAPDGLVYVGGSTFVVAEIL
ncbi:tetrahydrofolate synthase [Flavobacterium akiainvivens]|uniref:Dihydrofolate synthase/folylpolyglutamate synthase n=1 Tax=Flavobacterium akiainvivens TaxID=1202724 RepID=A0A0M9VJK5_9FLAO|nr:folylpolyglutamate synthase/dihydrofolate synthase family protein [Flavobacterium akiainvivens]KOS07559.1 tetrahydrofolate synthase [Flavobacterium akiainvivens]SFQ77833.1 dihydrofolate synthase / folylpolyglutamate synthase [Flavobacterium akiainvivens]